MVPNHLKYLTLSVASALAMLFTATLPGTALAQAGSGHSPVQMTGGVVTSGRLEFRQYCAPCHGMDAKGDGPVASSLKTKPADLTMIAKNNGGTFPTKEVYDTITGNSVVAGHGTREMPIWGTVFRTGNVAPGQRPRGPEAVKRMVEPLVAYIESIQVK